MEPTYFTCTLGQANSLGQRKPIQTINELVDSKAEEEGDTPAVGFYEPRSKSSQQWGARILTFRDIQRASEVVAATISQKLHSAAGETVALLCPSSPEFLFTWLASMKLGHPVLLIAPQCSPSAISHLCKTCVIRDLIYDGLYEILARDAASECANGDAGFNLVLLPLVGQGVLQAIDKSSESCSSPSAKADANDIAYLHHTSGTSSGVPKPIAQTHRAAVGVLPILDGRQAATFTTTPLYHGGIADLFRAWTSNALIWLFPGKELPITAVNVCNCLDIAMELAQRGLCPTVRYFSSVPYILQMMGIHEEGLKHLQSMDIVGVGGAALPSEVGNMLVEQGVHLISRFGSAECGFLMSSHREYSKDKEWEYLRSAPSGEFLQFEAREDGLSELVVHQGWPHLAKRNREDGSYATSDLFMPHPSIADAWRYHSRSDSQLTLITGKKFDPAPLEDAIKASSLLIEDVLIFGNGKPYAGALLFRSQEASSKSDDEVVAEIALCVEKLNKGSQSHAKISQSMLIPMTYRKNGLQKSSKGTVIRTQAEKQYAQEIETAYNVKLPVGDFKILDAEIPQAIHEIVTSVVGNANAELLTDDTDLFYYGADSVACIQIRQALSRLVPGAVALPVSVVEDSGTIGRLSNFILRLRSGEDVERQDDQVQLMSDLVKQYSVGHREPSSLPSSRTPNKPPSQAGLRILLTGATGSLGSHLLHQILCDARVGHVFLLVRGTSTHASRERVIKALYNRGLDVPPNFESKTTFLPGKLSESNLGLATSDYEHLAGNLDLVLHLAWSVNFLISLRTIAGTHLSGLQNLLNLALGQQQSALDKPPPRFIFCSSVAAVSNFGSLDNLAPGDIPEQFVSDPRVSGPTGYARSKWVGEAICAEAHKSTRLRDCISVARVGQLSGATDTGIWSKSEAYPLLLSSAKATGVLPDLKDEILNWLPGDIAAKAFVETALCGPLNTRTIASNRSEMPVHHVLNPNMTVRWSDLIQWLSPHASFEIVPVEEWLSKLAALQDDERTKHHPALRLLEFWRRAYESEPGTGSKHTDDEKDKQPSEEKPGYQMQETLRSMPVLENASGIMDETYVMKLWNWVQAEL